MKEGWCWGDRWQGKGGREGEKEDEGEEGLETTDSALQLLQNIHNNNLYNENMTLTDAKFKWIDYGSVFEISQNQYIN